MAPSLTSLALSFPPLLRPYGLFVRTVNPKLSVFETILHLDVVLSMILANNTIGSSSPSLTPALAIMYYS